MWHPPLFFFFFSMIRVKEFLKLDVFFPFLMTLNSCTILPHSACPLNQLPICSLYWFHSSIFSSLPDFGFAEVLQMLLSRQKSAAVHKGKMLLLSWLAVTCSGQDGTSWHFMCGYRSVFKFNTWHLCWIFPEEKTALFICVNTMILGTKKYLSYHMPTSYNVLNSVDCENLHNDQAGNTQRQILFMKVLHEMTSSFAYL